jgi:anti-sigma B factor antagonist
MILKIELKTMDPDIDVFAMAGRLTMGSDSQQVEWNLAKLLKENHRKVIFDLTDINFLDSSGVGILVMCHAKLKKAGGALRIAGAQGMVQQVLEMTNVTKIVDFYPTASEAVKNFTLA